DATDMAAMLKQLSFSVDLITDANQRTMDEAIRRFGRKLIAEPAQDRQSASKESAHTVGLFYFSGHGIQVNGENFLIPIGANIEKESEVKYTAVSAGKILDALEEAKNRVNLILIDACRDNPFAKGWKSGDRGLAPMQAASGMLISYATAPG